MDKVYIMVLLVMIIPILVCIKYAGKVKSEVASSIVKCLVFAIITILSNGLFVFSDNQLFSYFMEGLYLFSFDMLLIHILQYSQQYTRVFNEVTLFQSGNWLYGHDFDKRDCAEWSAQRTIDNEIHYYDIEYRKLFAKKGEYIG